MAYTDLVRVLRQCQGTRKDGAPCQGWAMWQHPDGLHLCGQHAGRGHRGPQVRWRVSFAEQLATCGSQRGDVVPCRCVAYQWPHRPGGGLCRWPDPPQWMCTLPAGTHSLGYTRPARWR
jgi:hypothetical protein